MTEVASRLEPAGQSGHLAIGTVTLPPAGTTWNRWLLPAVVAGALIGVTVFNDIWLVDDLTLSKAGGFGCLASATGSAPTNP